MKIDLTIRALTGSSLMYMGVSSLITYNTRREVVALLIFAIVCFTLALYINQSKGKKQ